MWIVSVLETEYKEMNVGLRKGKNSNKKLCTYLPSGLGMFGSFAESLITSILWWRMSQAGTQVDISTKFHTIVKLEKMLK